MTLLEILGFIVFFTTATVLCAVLLRAFERVANRVGLVDLPGGRKVHKKPIPLIGGLAIGATLIVSLTISSWFWENLDTTHVHLVCISYVLLFMGTIDDRVGLKALHRLLIQSACAVQVAIAGVRLPSLYGVFGIYELTTFQSYLLTVIVIVGVVNAFNLMDGIDGLAGSLSLIVVIILGVVAWMLESATWFVTLIVLAGGLAGFLKRNLSKGKVFLGDGGSMFLGFFLVATGVHFTTLAERTSTVPADLVVALVYLVLVIPVFDALRVFWMRITRGFSPFHPDKTHIHHVLLFFRYSHGKSTTMIVGAMILVLIAGIILFKSFNLATVLFAVSVGFWLLNWILSSLYWLAFWKRKTEEIENLTGV